MIRGSDNVRFATEKIAGAKRLLRLERALSKARKHPGKKDKALRLEKATETAAAKYRRRVSPGKGKALQSIFSLNNMVNSAAAGFAARGVTGEPGIVPLIARTLPFVPATAKAVKNAQRRRRYLSRVGATKSTPLSEIAIRAVRQSNPTSSGPQATQSLRRMR